MRRGALFTDILYEPHGQQERKASHGICGRADLSISLDDRSVSAIVRNAGGTVDEALARDWFPGLEAPRPELLTLPAEDYLPYESRSSCIALHVLRWILLLHHDDMPYVCRSAKGVPLCPSSDWSEVPGEQTRLARAEQAMMMVAQPIYPTYGNRRSTPIIPRSRLDPCNCTAPLDLETTGSQSRQVCVITAFATVPVFDK
jgi:hypothetical protein